MSICAKNEWCPICMDNHIEGNHTIKPTNTEQPKKELLEWVEITEKNRDEIIVGLDRNQEYGTVTQSDEKRFMTGADIQCLSRSIFKRLLLPAKQEVMISDEMIEEVIKFYKYQTLREHDVANCIANDITRLFRVAEFNRSQLLPKPATGEEAIKIRDEMDADMEDSGMAQGEIESCLNHWSNKYVITRTLYNNQQK